MELTTFKSHFLTIFLAALLPSCAFAQAQSSEPAGSAAWVNKAATAPFPQKRLHGQIDGIDFDPASVEIFVQRQTSGRNDEKVSFKDGAGRQVDVTVYGVSKFENAVYTQTPSIRLKGASTLRVESGLHTLSANEFGIRLSFGKRMSTGTQAQPIYIIVRQDRGNWMEGCSYALVHD